MEALAERAPAGAADGAVRCRNEMTEDALLNPADQQDAVAHQQDDAAHQQDAVVHQQDAAAQQHDAEAQHPAPPQSKPANFARYKAGEVGEVSVLRARVDDQSALIMALKRRVDDVLHSAQALEQSKARVEQRAEELSVELNMRANKCHVLEQRFADLASNHEEIIKFKDEYKRRNAELVEQNARLSSDNARLFSATIDQQAATIARLEQARLECRLELGARDKQLHETEARLKRVEDRSMKEHQRSESALRQTQDKLNDVEAELSRLRESRVSAEAEAELGLVALRKERDELVALTVARGRLVQERQVEVHRLEQRLELTEQSVRATRDKLQQQQAAASVSRQVAQLTRSLQQLQQQHDATLQEFEAYKVHSQSLLQRERELNARLRHLAD